MEFVKVSEKTVRTTLKIGQYYLKKRKIPHHDLEGEILLAAAIQKPREYLYAHSEYILSRSELLIFEKFIIRRAKREPAAYIIGVKEFYGYLFFVNKNVLIPRPETEGLIDLGLEEFKKLTKHEINNVDIIDVGTGSGAIIISLLKSLQDSRFKIQDSRFIAIDSSKKALATTQENARRLGVAEQIQFLRGNLLLPYINSIQNPNHKLKAISYKLIIANLPYLTSKEMRGLQPEVRFEPKKALNGGRNGLDVYRIFFKQLSKLRAHSFTAICEIAPTQIKTLQKILKMSFPNSETKFSKDFAKRTRFVKIKYQ